jgi:hypothetical protein
MRTIFEGRQPKRDVLSGELRDEMCAARLEDVVRGAADPAGAETSENRPPFEVRQNKLGVYAAVPDRLALEPVSQAISDLVAEEPHRHEGPHDDWAREEFRDRLEEWVGGDQSGTALLVEEQGFCPGCGFPAFCRCATRGAGGLA